MSQRTPLTSPSWLALWAWGGRLRALAPGALLALALALPAAPLQPLALPPCCASLQPQTLARPRTMTSTSSSASASRRCCT